MTPQPKHRIFPLGDDALTIEFGREISVELNNLVLKLAEYLAENSFEGLIETVPAYSSLTVFYDVLKIRKSSGVFANAFEKVKNSVETALLNLDDERRREENSCVIEIPVCFDAEFAPDLEFVASENNLSPAAVKKIFLDKIYRVFMLGFLPGFSYMGELDEKIAAPRKSSPRLKVPAGSVGIAGRQTGIYSLESPGGWQIIGQTPIETFTPNARKPAILEAGEFVKFYEIDAKKFDEIKDNRRK